MATKWRIKPLRWCSSEFNVFTFIYNLATLPTGLFMILRNIIGRDVSLPRNNPCRMIVASSSCYEWSYCRRRFWLRCGKNGSPKIQLSKKTRTKMNYHLLLLFQWMKGQQMGCPSPQYWGRLCKILLLSLMTTINTLKVHQTKTKTSQLWLEFIFTRLC